MAEIIETKDDLMRKSILEAAQQLFQEYGLGKTTMEDIAKKIGKAKSSLYYYYANKDEIFEAVVFKEKRDVQNDINLAIEKETTASGKLRAFAFVRYRTIKKKKVLYKILSNEMQNNPCMINNLRENYNQIEHDIISCIISMGIASGEFKIAKEDLNIVCYVVNSSLRGLEFDAMMSTKNKVGNSVEIIEKAIMLLLRALSC